jgi:hypothetical protein
LLSSVIFVIILFLFTIVVGGAYVMGERRLFEYRVGVLTARNSNLVGRIGGRSVVVVLWESVPCWILA